MDEEDGVRTLRKGSSHFIASGSSKLVDEVKEIYSSIENINQDKLNNDNNVKRKKRSKRTRFFCPKKKNKELFEVRSYTIFSVFRGWEVGWYVEINLGIK